jgi:hypothetical protein
MWDLVGRMLNVNYVASCASERLLHSNYAVLSIFSLFRYTYWMMVTLHHLKCKNICLNLKKEGPKHAALMYIWLAACL